MLADLEITWRDILQPGATAPAEGRPDPFAELDIPDFSPGRGFSRRLAEFLAGQSCLIYYAEKSRREVWGRIGYGESLCTDDAHAFCSLVEPLGRSAVDRPALLVFRGTTHFKQWLTNLQSVPKSWPEGGHVHSGFAEAHEEVWRRVSPGLERIIRAGRPLLITGHSLGGALATLTLSRLTGLYGCPANLCAYTFGSPRVGNLTFAQSLAEAPLYRLVRDNDLVTRFPIPFNPLPQLNFYHAGDTYLLGPDGRLRHRGRIDPGEDPRSVYEVGALLADAFSAARENRPPPPLADHAPVAYWQGLRSHPAGGS